MEPSRIEKQLSEVACLLDELNGVKFSKSNWEGYHPRVYGGIKKADADKMVDELCSKIQKLTAHELKFHCSLELQMWWRDHQKADKKRIKQEKKELRENQLRNEALAKLTPYERKLLNLN